MPSLFCLWSLLAFYHNTNNLIMMLPAFVFVWFLDDRTASPRHWLPIGLLQAALMFDVPTRLGPRMSHESWAKAAVDDFDRYLVLASFGYVAWRWHRLTRPGTGENFVMQGTPFRAGPETNEDRSEDRTP